MSLKTKLTSLITTFVLLCSLLTVGVFAVKNTTFNVGGKIEFTVDGIEATIALSNTGLTNIALPEGVTAGNQVFAPITIDNSTTAESIASQFAKWSNLDLKFAQEQSTASIELVITNTSSDDNNYIDITALADATTKENAKIKVENKNEEGISALISSGDSATFVITFSVLNDEYKASLNDFNVSFEMKKLTPDDVQETIEGLTITKNATTKKASIESNSLEGEDISLNLPKYVLHVDGETKTICTVTSIEDYAFSDCGSLTNITIGSGVTRIGEGAFLGCGLKSITIPDSVTSMGDWPLSDCPNLTSVIISDNLTSIGDSAFRNNTKLESITIPSSVTTIVGWAFWGCTSLTSVIMSYGLTSIGEETFYDCESLTSITIPSSVTSIGADVFSGCNNLTSIVVESGNNVYDSRNNCNALIETATNKLIKGCQNTVIPNTVTTIGWGVFYNCSGLTTISIPNTVKEIGKYAFYGCSSLTNITIGSGVTSIGYNAFEGCSSLTNITIGSGVTSIGNQAFYKCSGITSIVVESGNSVYDSRNNCNALIETATNTLIVGCQNTDIPNTVTSIGKYAFYGCSGLTTISIPNTVKEIGEYAFYGCTSLKYNKISESDEGKYLGNASNPYFALIGTETKTLTEYSIHNDCKVIAGTAFYRCESLKNITIPDGIISVGTDAFYDCYLRYYAIGEGRYLGNANHYYLVLLKTGAKTLTEYSIHNDCKVIANRAFSGCSSLTSITIPDSVTSIGNSAFYNCSKLATINYTGTQEEWNAITGLADADIPSNVTINFEYTGA